MTKIGGGGHIQAVEADGQVVVNVGVETYLFAPRGGHFHLLPNPPTPRRDAAFAAVGDRLLLIGGVSGDEPCAEVWSLRLGETAWARAPDLPVGLTQAGAAGAGDLLDVAGGVTRWGSLPWTSAEVWRYDGRKEIWGRAPSLPARVRRPALAASCDDIYALGGLRCVFPFALRPSERVWRLPAGGHRWRADRLLGERAAHPAAACAEGRLFEAAAAGHMHELQRQAGGWVGLPSLPAPAARVAVGVPRRTAGVPPAREGDRSLRPADPHASACAALEGNGGDMRTRMLARPRGIAAAAGKTPKRPDEARGAGHDLAHFPVLRGRPIRAQAAVAATAIRAIVTAPPSEAARNAAPIAMDRIIPPDTLSPASASGRNPSVGAAGGNARRHISSRCALTGNGKSTTKRSRRRAPQPVKPGDDELAVGFAPVPLAIRRLLRHGHCAVSPELTASQVRPCDRHVTQSTRRISYPQGCNPAGPT